MSFRICNKNLLCLLFMEMASIQYLELAEPMFHVEICYMLNSNQADRTLSKRIYISYLLASPELQRRKCFTQSSLIAWTTPRGNLFSFSLRPTIQKQKPHLRNLLMNPFPSLTRFFTSLFKSSVEFPPSLPGSMYPPPPPPTPPQWPCPPQAPPGHP